MLVLMAKTRTFLSLLKSVVGIAVIGIILTWIGLELGLDRETLKEVAIWSTVGLVALLVILNMLPIFSVTGHAVKPVASLLLVINLSQWSVDGFTFWVSAVSSLSLTYIILLAYEKYFNKMAYHVALDKFKAFTFEPEADADEKEIEITAIRAVINTFKDKYKDKLFAYFVGTTPNSNGNNDVTIDFALDGKTKHKLFDVIVSYEKD